MRNCVRATLGATQKTQNHLTHANANTNRAKVKSHYGEIFWPDFPPGRSGIFCHFSFSFFVFLRGVVKLQALYFELTPSATVHAQSLYRIKLFASISDHRNAVKYVSTRPQHPI